MGPEPDGPVIVVGFDGSETGHRALHYALGLAHSQGGRVIAAYAQPLGTTAWHASTGAAVVASLPEIAAQISESVAEAVGTSPVPVQTTAHVGAPISMLIKVASEHHADQIVVGASSSRRHRLLGSVGLRLVRVRRWPVTVVP